uniref:Uncharacterized protein n=1 Tax=Anguilla anguilla TaxID=7936 RepID=A0A0E9WUR6_ANGAN
MLLKGKRVFSISGLSQFTARALMAIDLGLNYGHQHHGIICHLVVRED